MKDQNFESLPAEETQDHFQNAMELYHSGFVEDGYALKSLASVRVEDALECAGRVLEDFKYAQRKVIYEAARTGADLEHFMNPKFSATHMKFILEQEQAGKNVSWLFQKHFYLCLWHNFFKIKISCHTRAYTISIWSDMSGNYNMLCIFTFLPQLNHESLIPFFFNLKYRIGEAFPLPLICPYSS